MINCIVQNCCYDVYKLTEKCVTVHKDAFTIYRACPYLDVTLKSLAVKTLAIIKLPNFFAI